MQKKEFQLKNQYRCPKGYLGRQVAKQMNQGHKKLTLWGLTKIKIASDSVILDVGCGGGKTLTRLAQLAPHGTILGIDHSPDMVKYSKKVNQKLIAQNRVRIVLGTVEKMNFEDNYFDLVTAIESYYFWPNFQNALTEIKRVLKPKGKIFLVNEMIKDGKWEAENAELITQTQVHLIPLKQIQDIMLSIGFEDAQVFTKNKSPWNAILVQK